MPLLEIVVTPKTADWALARAQAYGASQGKSMIVVKDSPGFYTTRILAPFLNEAVLLLEEGANILAIDGAIKDFGFPVGPIALIDEVGIDVGAHVSKDLGRAFAARDLNTSDLLNHLHDAGFGGRKNRKGFYLYPESKKSAWPGLVVSLLNKKPKKEANPEVYEKLAQLRPGWVLKSSDHSSKSSGKLAERIVWMMINEAMLCLQEGVIRSARDGDVGAILGLGFAPFRGGPFKYVDSLGLDQALATMRKLEKAHGPRFRPAPILVEMAKTGGAFYADEKQGGRS